MTLTCDSPAQNASIEKLLGHMVFQRLSNHLAEKTVDVGGQGQKLMLQPNVDDVSDLQHILDLSRKG